MIPVELLYSAYLKKKRMSYESNKAPNSKIYHSPSSAGRCLKIHQFKQRGVPTDQTDPKSRRLLRLGDIIGDDIETGVKEMWNDPNVNDYLDFPVQLQFKGELLTQAEVVIEKLNVRGRIDLAQIDGDTLNLVDVKTTSAYQWKKKFGREPEKSNGMYEMQVSSYAMAIIIERPEIKKVNVSLEYYKKDTSDMKSMKINITEFFPRTRQYWDTVNNSMDMELTPGDDMVPIQSWECNYCSYSSKCNSPFKKKK